MHQIMALPAGYKDDKAVLIYDRYDIWNIDPATGYATNFTKGVGRKNKLIMRYDMTDPEQKFIPAEAGYVAANVQNEANQTMGYIIPNIQKAKRLLKR
jgi:hypothetical protein